MTFHMSCTTSKKGPSIKEGSHCSQLTCNCLANQRHPRGIPFSHGAVPIISSPCDPTLLDSLSISSQNPHLSRPFWSTVFSTIDCACPTIVPFTWGIQTQRCPTCDRQPYLFLSQIQESNPRASFHVSSGVLRREPR